MKTIIFILALSAIAAPIYTAACDPVKPNTVSCTTGGLVSNACAAGYFLATGNTCTLCPNGKGKVADAAGDTAGTANANGDTVCNINSSAGCNVNNGVAGGAGCLNCAAGYYLSAAGTCTICPATKGKLVDTTIPTAEATGTACAVASMGGCNVNNGATGGMGCLNCKAGWFKSAADTCSWCTGGKGKAADPATAITAVATETAACTVTCAATSNCVACSDTAATCLACANGRYLKADSTCAACAMGTWRTAPTTPVVAGEADTVCTICAKDTFYTATGCTNCPAGKTRAAPTTAPTAVETDSVCMTAGGSGSSATLIQALCGASVAAYALF